MIKKIEEFFYWLMSRRTSNSTFNRLLKLLFMPLLALWIIVSFLILMIWLLLFSVIHWVFTGYYLPKNINGLFYVLVYPIAVFYRNF